MHRIQAMEAEENKVHQMSMCGTHKNRIIHES